MALRQLPCDPGKHSSSPPTTRGACYRHEDRWRGKHGSVSREPSWLRILSYSRNPNCTEVEMCPRATGRWLWRPVLPSGSHFPHLLQVKAALEDASEDLPNPTSTFPGSLQVPRHVVVLTGSPPEKAWQLGLGMSSTPSCKSHPTPPQWNEEERRPAPVIAPCLSSVPAGHAVGTACTQQVPAIQ